MNQTLAFVAQFSFPNLPTNREVVDLLFGIALVIAAAAAGWFAFRAVVISIWGEDLPDEYGVTYLLVTAAAATGFVLIRRGNLINDPSGLLGDSWGILLLLSLVGAAAAGGLIWLSEKSTSETWISSLIDMLATVAVLIHMVGLVLLVAALLVWVSNPV